MNKLLATTVRRLTAEGWQFDPCSDLDALIELTRLAEYAVGTDSRDPRYVAALNPVLEFAGQRFERPSIGVSEFDRECVSLWYKDDPRMYDLAWCWLLAHARDPEAVWAHQHAGRETFTVTVRLWLRGLAVTEDELRGAITAWINKGRMLQTAADAAAKREAQDLSAAIEELAAEYGEPDLAEWLWKKSESEVSLLRDRMLERKAREQGVHTISGSDRFHAAMSAYRKAELAFIASVTERGCQPRQQGDGRNSVAPQTAHRAAQQPHGTAQGSTGSATT